MTCLPAGRFMKLNKNIKIFFNYFLGPVLFAWVSYSIYNQVQRQPDLERSWLLIRASFGSPLIINLIAVFVLMIVNWGIEAYKWKISVQRIQQVSYFTAFKAILSGTSFSVTTPNRVGEYLGRVLYMNEGNRLKAISLTIAGSMSQLIITLFMGLLGFIMLRKPIEDSHLLSAIWIQVMVYGILFVLLGLTVFYFRLSWIIKWIDRLPGIRKYAWLLKGLEDFNATLMLQLLSLSALRFLVFLIQYYLLFRLCSVNVSWWQASWAVSVSFLVMAVIPTIALFTDLSLRGQVSLKLIGLFSGNNLGIGLTSVSIWFINLIIPALAGSLLILGIKKIFKNNNDEKT
jgi:Lysylphosphatidylglycerol synthase TM region